LNSKITHRHPDRIGYEKHPAYTGLIASATVSQKIKSITTFCKYACIVFIKRVISYEQIPAHLRKPKTMSGFKLLVTRTLRHLARSVTANDISIVGLSAHVFNTLQTQGICVVPTNADQFNKVMGMAALVLERLRQQRGQRITGDRDFSESRTSILRTTDEALFISVETLLFESGILDAASKYLKRPANVIDINPQINDSSDNFWQRIFPDLSAEKPATKYFHRDASGGDLKAIIYLTDVDSDNGPFSFVRGSHKIKPGRLRNFIQEVNDTSGFSATSLDARQQFAALPAWLRSKCAFGNDLLSDSESAQHILDGEWKVIAPKGNVVLFDSKGIHRGGMVLNKERIVLTCVLG
jgi:hypothetical protein